MIGHAITTCKWLNPEAAKETLDRGKRAVIEGPLPRNIIPRQQWVPRGDAGASTSAQLTVTETARLATPVQPVQNFELSIPSVVPTAPISKNSVAANLFSFALQNFSDEIAQGRLPITDRPMFELASNVAHDDVHSHDMVQKQHESRTIQDLGIFVVASPLSQHVEHIDVHVSPSFNTSSSLSKTRPSQLDDIHGSDGAEVTVACKGIDAAIVVPTNTAADKSLSFVLQNVLDKLPQGRLTSSDRPLLELASNVAHNDVHSCEMEQTQHQSRTAQDLDIVVPAAPFSQLVEHDDMHFPPSLNTSTSASKLVSTPSHFVDSSHGHDGAFFTVDYNATATAAREHATELLTHLRIQAHVPDDIAALQQVLPTTTHD